MDRRIDKVVRVVALILLLAAGVMLVAAPSFGQTGGTQTASLNPAAANPIAHPQPKPIARVNGAVLTEIDLLREVYAIFPYARQHNGGIPKVMEADIRRGALKMIEFEELVYQEAKRRGMKIAPERLAKSEQAFRKQFDTKEDFQAFVQVEGNGSMSVIRTKIIRSLLIEDMLKAEVADKSAVTLAETKAFYLKNTDRFKLPEAYSLQTITIMPPTRPTPQQPAPPPPSAADLKKMNERAQDALKQAKATKTFEDYGVLAEKISDDDYRVMMGNHKSVKTGDLPPGVLSAVSKMEVGQVSDVIQAEGALTIVRLNAHTQPRTQTFREVADDLRARLRQQKTESLRHELDAKLRKGAKIEEL